VETPLWLWIAFHIGVFIAITVDLAQFKRRDRELSIRAAARRTAIWIFLSLLFNLVVWKFRGAEHALDFLTGYVIEYSLSVDNIFVFVLIFSYFRVPPRPQHRVLVWGILGALIMRGIVIFLGVALVSRFHWILYVFGIFLIVTGVRMFFGKPSEKNLGETLLLRCCRTMIPVTPEFNGEHFKAKINGAWLLTPLALTLVVIELTDLIFAVDSIPAVFAITQDQFIVYTSNICAILGLRSLYFLIAKVIDRLIYLRTGLSILLAFVGFKMILADHLRIRTWVSLLIILVILSITIIASLAASQKSEVAAETAK
jgi:tellurite resistance protein TerC